MAATGEEAVGSMGTDTPISALSDKSKLLYTYFKQNFAQVTNPPIDPIREELVMSLVSIIGPRPNLFDLEGTSQHQAPRSAPADPDQRGPGEDPRDLRRRRQPVQVDARSTSPSRPSTARPAWSRRSTQLCARSREGGARRHQHHHPVRPQGRRRPRADPVAARLRGRASSPDPQGPAHLGRARRRDPASRARCITSRCLAGYGAEAINPYLAFETLIAMKDELPQKLDEKEIVKRYIKAIGKGMLKVMSKMGISTYQSYCGAQIFDAVGLTADFVDTYFTGTATRIEGVGLDRDRRRDRAPPPRRLRRLAGLRDMLDVGGDYAVPHARRGPCLERRDGRDAAARRARQFATTSTASSRKLVNEQSETLRHHPRPVPHQERRGGRPQAGAARRGRAGEGHRASASRPARCPTARSRARRTPRSPSP